MNLQQVAMTSVDALYAAIPRRRPEADALQQARLVAHRGTWGNGRPENTLAAFDASRQAGIWGIELDIRWTADLQPIVLHDPDCTRVFGVSCVPAQVTLAELRHQVPGVPTLSEVVAHYGRKLHLMIEIKDETYPAPKTQSKTLQDALAPLSPTRDYHLLALDTQLFDRFPWLPAESCVTVALTNVRSMSEQTLEKRYGAFTGHYLLIGARRLQRHQAAGQQVGVGFSTSRNGLIREINRGADWIFTNQSLKLQKHLDHLRSSTSQAPPESEEHP